MSILIARAQIVIESNARRDTSRRVTEKGETYTILNIRWQKLWQLVTLLRVQWFVQEWIGIPLSVCCFAHSNNHYSDDPKAFVLLHIREYPHTYTDTHKIEYMWSNEVYKALPSYKVAFDINSP